MPYEERRTEKQMKEWMIRLPAGIAALTLTILFFVMPIGEENTVRGSVYDGRSKFELAAGEKLTWEWTPEEDGITGITLRARGSKNARELILDTEMETPAGEKVFSSRNAVSELNDQGEWEINGLFSAGTAYRITVSGSGEGSIRLNGTEEEDGFRPAMKWQKKTLDRYGIYLYLGVGFLLFALLPVPARRNGKGRAGRLLMTGGLLLLSVLWFVQTTGIPRAYRMDEAMILAWCLHYGAWLYLSVMGKLLFGSSLSMEKKSAFAAVLFGILLMVAITPNSAPDEAAHYSQSYGLSNYLLFQKNKEEGDARDFDLDMWEENFNSESGYTQIGKRLFEKRGSEENGKVWVPSSFTYPIMYLPQAAGLAVGRLLRVNVLTLYYLGRLFNLLFYSFCVYAAVKSVPLKKELFFGIGMMPMALHQAASYSYDAFTNGMAILWTALALRAILEKGPMEKKEYFTLILVGGLMAPSKVGYMILAGLLFLIPQRRFVHLNKPAAVGGIILSMAAFTAVFWLPAAISGSSIHRSGDDVFTLEAMLQQPVHVLRILFYSAEENMLEWLAEAAGFVFCGYSLWINVLIPVVYLILLLALAQKKNSEPELGSRGRNRAAMLAIIGFGILMIEMVELFSWTPVVADRVYGIQGRYFIPLIPLVFLATETKSIQRRDCADDRKLAWGLALLHAITLDHILIQTFRGV